MNLALDSSLFSQEYPTQLTREFSWGSSVCVRFNPSGDYIASGLNNGAIVIIDFDTLSALKVLREHIGAITSLAWSTDGRYLLSASEDWKCVLWDLKVGEAVKIIRLGASVWHIAIHPTKKTAFVAVLIGLEAVYVDLSSNEERDGELIIHTLPKNEVKKSIVLSAVIHPNGKYAITSTSKGELNVIDLETLELKYVENAGRSAIPMTNLSPSGKNLLCVCQDKVIRKCVLTGFDGSEELNVTVDRKFEDVVNKRSWSSVGFDPREEFVAATVVHGHGIVLWETEMATLQKIYEGPKEELQRLDFHPRRPLFIAVGIDTGKIYCFEPKSEQKWSSLAPDFVELEDNEDYSECEDDFDLYDDWSKMNAEAEAAEDKEVDILTPLDDSKPSFVIPVELHREVKKQPNEID